MIYFNVALLQLTVNLASSRYLISRVIKNHLIINNVVLANVKYIQKDVLQKYPCKYIQLRQHYQRLTLSDFFNDLLQLTVNLTLASSRYLISRALMSPKTFPTGENRNNFQCRTNKHTASINFFVSEKKSSEQ